MKHDNEGRQFIALHDVRSAVRSASASLSTGTAVTLLAGDADYFLDIVELSFANNSTASASVVLSNDGTTIRTLQIGAGTSQLRFDVPVRQAVKNTPWILDMEDVTGTSVVVDAVLIKAS